MRKLSVNLPAAVFLVAAIALVAGCGGSKEKSESTATEKMTATTEAHGGAGEQESQATQQAVDWSAYSNPKAGVCPVCQMNLEPAYVTEVTIAEKKYACCSSRCVNMLSENPDQYLSAAASTEESHEGHTH
jgi:YHS domain-containing protein